MSSGQLTRRRGWFPWVALFAVAYVLSPADLIPDILPGAGYADDALVSLAGLLHAAWQRKRFVEARRAAVS